MAVTPSPHLLLGVDPDAGPEEIQLGFARAVKRLRSMPEMPISVQDLTEALNRLEKQSEDGASILDQFFPSDGVLKEALDPLSVPILMSRVTPPCTELDVSSTPSPAETRAALRAELSSLAEMAPGFDKMDPATTTATALPRRNHEEKRPVAAAPEKPAPTQHWADAAVRSQEGGRWRRRWAAPLVVLLFLGAIVPGVVANTSTDRPANPAEMTVGAAWLVGCADGDWVACDALGQFPGGLEQTMARTCGGAREAHATAPPTSSCVQAFGTSEVGDPAPTVAAVDEPTPLQSGSNPSDHCAEMGSETVECVPRNGFAIPLTGPPMDLNAFPEDWVFDDSLLIAAPGRAHELVPEEVERAALVPSSAESYDWTAGYNDTGEWATAFHAPGWSATDLERIFTAVTGRPPIADWEGVPLYSMDVVDESGTWTIAYRLVGTGLFDVVLQLRRPEQHAVHEAPAIATPEPVPSSQISASESAQPELEDEGGFAHEPGATAWSVVRLSVVHPDGAAVAEVFERWGSGINTGDYDAALSVYTNRLREQVGREEFVEGNRTSSIESVEIAAIAGSGQARTVRGVMISHQAASHGHNGQTCSQWDMEYGLTRGGGDWLIDSARETNGGPRTC